MELGMNIHHISRLPCTYFENEVKKYEMHKETIES